MKRILLSVCVLLATAGNLFGADIVVPAGTRIEGTTMFGTFAPAKMSTAQNFSLSIIVSTNPAGTSGSSIPLKDCVILGGVVADVTVNRAFFRAIRIACPNAKETNGTPIKGYAVDVRDNKLGIQGVSPAPAATQRYVEIAPDTKITFYNVEGIIITIK
jgi:hypothetical protein